MKGLPRVVITMGDPAGIGPEVIVKALSDEKLNRSARFIIVGDHGLFIRAWELASKSVKVLPLNSEPVSSFNDPAFRPDALNIMNAAKVSRNLIWGKISPEGGKAAAQAIEVATKMVLNGEADALVTAPISKQALQIAGVPYAGHTDFLAALCGVSETRLMLVCDELKVVHATGHMSLRKAIDNLTTERIVKTVELSLPTMRLLGYERPRIAIAALNPHAGEGGMFGDEDERFVCPAVEKLRGKGYEVFGPVPADSVFWRARNGEFDVVVALYHDQGHIPIKVLAFDRGVNVTVGLPIIRTSPDHGVAFDIAWQNKAQATSMCAAIELAVRMAKRRILEQGGVSP